ncbi:hypothetical protein VTN02DRAFT_5453 [Thermoascus thermophilus]
MGSLRSNRNQRHVSAEGGHGSGLNSGVDDAGQSKQSTLRRAHTVAQGVAAKRSGGRRTAKDGANSLLRGRNSSVVLRQRSLKRSNAQEGAPKAFTGGREAKHFTVGNVGNNGRMYLRPMVRVTHSSPVSHSPIAPPTGTHLRPPPSRGDEGSLARHSIWSSSQLSELCPGRYREENDGESEFDGPESSDAEGYHKKVHSFSTTAEHRSSSKHGEIRIVTDRFDDDPKPDEKRVPTLEVPIPHYRLGEPQFNAEGTAVLRSSMGTRTDVPDNLFSSTPPEADSEHVSADDPGDSVEEPVQQGRHLSFAVSMFSGAAPAALSRSASVTQKSVFYKLKEPIEPSIFDTLMLNLDDPSVVKYISGTKNISAATPARIVAEISSDSFMDYELVSDFFLTFRSYLSASNLLSLLLARLQWAINRLQEDGRIIRIRTFAALRHWILNYFVDDFVLNRDLRVQFCEKINSMCEDVKARESGGTSDLKILIDLKRCWNGRCSLYWDFPDPSGNSPENPIVPGGVAGSRDIYKTRVSETGTLYSDTVLDAELPNYQPHGLPAPNASREERPAHPNRQVSSATAQRSPMSPPSESSLQSVLCSLPSISPKSRPSPHHSGSASHPITVVTERLSQTCSDTRSPVSATSRCRPFNTHMHKRSGSFSDSVRDLRDGRALSPLADLDSHRQPLIQTVPYSGSLIRGHLFPPAEPYVAMIGPPSPSPLPYEMPGLDHRSSLDGDTRHTPSPGVRTIIGSIRRALHSRHGTQTTTTTVQTGRGNSILPLRGRTPTTAPVNVAFGSEKHRDRRVSTVPRNALRIDILCEDAKKKYLDALGQGTERLIHANEGRASAQVHTESSKPGQFHAAEPGLEGPSSQVTMGSKSIAAIDDTGLDFPAMSGAVPAALSSGEPTGAQHLSSESKTIDPIRAWDSSGQAATESTLPDHYREFGSRSPNRESTYLQPPDEHHPRRSFSVNRRSLTWKTTSISSRLRKYASFQSGMTRFHPGDRSDTEASFSGEHAPHDAFEKPLARMLRRLPGGDLRKVENVHDLESGHRPGSSDSGASNSDEFPGQSIDADKHRTSTFDVRPSSPPPRFSLIQTHSFQHMRPSLEAAIAEFAEIPDDEDGGVESALLKLEGKYVKSPTSARSPARPNEGQRYSGVESRRQYDDEEMWLHRNRHILEQQNFSADLNHSTDRRRTGLNSTISRSSMGGRTHVSWSYSASLVESEDSYNSIPLLERGLSDESMKRPRVSLAMSDVTAPRPLFSKIANRGTLGPESAHSSIDVVEETDSLRRIPPGLTVPVPQTRYTKDHISELASELSVDVVDPEEAKEDHTRSLSTDPQSLSISAALEMPPHPLAHPPSPPMTTQQHRSTMSYIQPLTSRPLTPDLSPTQKNMGRGIDRSLDMQQLSSNVLVDSERNTQHPSAPDQQTPAHVPFVLACDSQILAQQLTLVEKAALSEIDWKDLVDMRWSNTPSSSLNWAQFLSEEDRRGIDLVIGRFNLMVKWVVSEIVLTVDMDERARTITKFIHVAAHARRLCNYSTMLQIAIALSSIDCTRLRQTWSLVSPADRRLLKDMESLIQPVRNFHELRVEMETANLQEGCIPFVGLYIHDLTYNVQKPAQVASSGDGDPLVNFERYRTSARIIKSLLRLIDASTKYQIEAVPGVIERCLWISSLSDESIQAMSKSLE